MNPGETKEVSAKFPEDYPQKDIAGKAAVFTVTLKELKEKELPELNDDFAQEASEFETLAELRISLESRFQTEAERKTKANKEQALSDELLKHVEVELPETLIAQEVDAMLTQTAVQLSNQGIDVKKLFTPESIPQLRERSRPEAIERLKRLLALQEVAKRESIQLEPGVVEARVKELMAQYAGKDIDVDRLREVVAEELLTEKIMNWLEENATVELVAEGSLIESDADTQEEVMAIDVEASDADTQEDVVAINVEASDVAVETNQANTEPAETE
jgi:trigger factor